MARLKTQIKQLQTKYGISEEAATELLSLYDGDMGEAQAAAQAAVQAAENKWLTWYNTNVPAIAKDLEELDNLRAFKARVDSTLNPQPTPPNPAVTQPQPNAPSGFDPAAFESRIYDNFSAVQKDIYNIQRYHMKHYKELPDLEPIEKLIQDKKLSPWQAYQEWVQPMEKERTEKELRESITKELTEKFQAEASRRGTVGIFTRPESDVTSPLDVDVDTPPPPPQPGTTSPPNDLELMADFVGTMRQGRANQSH